MGFCLLDLLLIMNVGGVIVYNIQKYLVGIDVVIIGIFVLWSYGFKFIVIFKYCICVFVC